MTVSEQIKVLCICPNISVSRLARRIGKTSQALNSKMKRESFTVDELEIIAEAVKQNLSGSLFYQTEMRYRRR